MQNGSQISYVMACSKLHISPHSPFENCANSPVTARRWCKSVPKPINRLQKVLEGANIKLASVATDVLGKSGRSMLDALATGTNDPEMLAELARGRLRARIA